jgi:hypothetical protein
MAESRLPLQAEHLQAWLVQLGIEVAPAVSLLGTSGSCEAAWAPQEARYPIELAFLIENWETLSGPTANLGLAMTSAGCTSNHAPSGRRRRCTGRRCTRTQSGD